MHQDDNPRCELDFDVEEADKTSRRLLRKLIFAVSLSFCFFIMELVGGKLTGSLALLSDSFHLLSDTVSFAISLLSIYLARKPPTQFLSYGYHRAEILGALISVIVIWFITGSLVVQAVGRIKHPEEVDGKTMCIVASVGVVVNIILITLLGHNHNHNHSHHDSHHEEKSEQLKDSKNINIRAAMLHALGDLLSSIGVLISAIVIAIDPTKSWVDPICTFIFSALIFGSTIGILKSGVTILMEATPPNIDIKAVRSDLVSIKGVKSVHDLHVWDLTLGKTALTTHLEIDSNNSDIGDKPPVHLEIQSEARRFLKQKYNIGKVTIQIHDSKVSSNSLRSSV